MAAQKSKPKSKRASPRIRVDVGKNLRCAEFVGGDKTTHTTTNTITYGFSAREVEQLIEKVLAFLQAGAMFMPVGPLQDAYQAELNGEKLTFHPGAVQQLMRGKQRTERSYLLGLTLDQHYSIWATLFVPLRAHADVAREALEIRLAYSEIILPRPDAGPESQPHTEVLEDITEAVHKHRAFIILGAAGASKTTTLQKITFDQARLVLGADPSEATAGVPLFVRLSQQREQTPAEFLREAWRHLTAGEVEDALADGRLMVLADGLNELPRDPVVRAQRLREWREFVEENVGRNRFIFSSRERGEYAGELDLPNVRVEPLDSARIMDYLRRWQAESLAPVLANPQTRLGELASNPFYLNLLVTAYHDNARQLENRGQLLDQFAQRLFKREERRARPDWIASSVQASALSQLAFTTQAQGLNLTLEVKTARALTPRSVEVDDASISVKPDTLFNLARAELLLDPSLERDVRFYHQLVQEYFAALELLRRFDEGEDLGRLWAAPRLEQDTPPANVGEWEALPEPPGTGWEVTTILACGLARDPAKLIDVVRLHNPTLAGRCLHEAGITLSDDSPSPDRAFPGQGTRQRAGGGVLRSVRADLLAELYNPTVHLRARLQAGYTLGHIGDPRFEAQVLNGVKVIVPQTVSVSAGQYLIGSEPDETDSFDNEKPQHPIDLPAFAIGQWPVTNAEYACFMEAGGYKDEQWWKTDLAKRWLKGEDVMGGQSTTILRNVKLLQSIPNWKEQLEATGSFSPQALEAYESLITLDEDELKAKLSEQFSNKSRVQPEWWNDSTRNNPSQPVVGITWFEATAYCEWLSTVTGRPYRLPTEAEWEAAARGLASPNKGEGVASLMGVRVYPWGDEWEQTKANTIEGRVLKPSPVGAYTAVGNVGPFGGEDQSGNVWNWTSTLYKPYPYTDDATENPTAEGERVVRGGSWNSYRRFARCAYRSRNVPDRSASTLISVFECVPLAHIPEFCLLASDFCNTGFLWGVWGALFAPHRRNFFNKETL